MISGKTICIVTQQLGKVISGPGIYAFNLVNSLVKKGYNVHVIAPSNQRPSTPMNIFFHGVRTPVLEKNHARWIHLSILFSHEYQKINKDVDFDLVHFTDAREALFFSHKKLMIGNVNDTYAGELKTVNYYRHHYVDWFQRMVYYYLLHFLEQAVYKKMDVLVTNSDYTTSVVMNEYKISSERIIKCYKSINLQTWSTLAKDKDTKRNKNKQILFIGSNLQRKGLVSLINAAPEVIEKFPNARFVIVGEDPVIDKMKKLTNKLNVSSSFSFLHWQSRENIKNIYANSDVFVLPSLEEAFGVSILEAMAAGIPVIGSKAGGIPEIIQDGVNGLLITPDDSCELAKALNELLGKPKLAKFLTENAKQTIREFDLEKMMDCTYQIYNRLLDD